MGLKRYQPPQEMTVEEYRRRYGNARGGRRRKATDPALREAEAGIQRAILEWLAWNGILAARTNAGALGTEEGNWVQLLPKGWSDITGLLQVERDGRTIGVFLAIEVKAEDGDLRPEQEEFAAQVRLHGGCMIVARSVEDVIRGIAAFRADHTFVIQNS